MESIIKVDNLSKQYRLGNVGTGTIRDDLKRGWYRLRGKEDPFLRIGDTNDRSAKATGNYVWALKEINFEVQTGEVLGIIGRNGAGKSTLLKILSRVAEPTTGRVKMNGRVASLLEVGTGMHPDLTGRENIYLNGAILGMTRKEITRKFDEIVDFSGVERYIDTPVKRYSSGMHVRLGFAVAAHLEPEILIVDEVLAVGDAEFQKKCLGKMKDVSEKEGRTVLFVSHNMSAVRHLCTRAILLANGKMAVNNTVDHVLNCYQKANQSAVIDLNNFDRKGSGICRINKLEIISNHFGNGSIHKLGDRISIIIYIKNLCGKRIEDLQIIIGIYNLSDEGYLRFDTKTTNTYLEISENGVRVTCNVNEHLNIRPDQYSLNIAILKDDSMIDYIAGGIKFSIENDDYYETGRTIPNPELSKVFYKHSWELG